MNTHRVIIGLGSLLLVIGLLGAGNGQPLDKLTPEALLAHFLETREGHKELLARGTTLLPLLYSRLDDAQHRRLDDAQPGVRRTAVDLLGELEVRRAVLDLLGELDIKHDGVLNQEETVRTMVKILEGSESDAAVVDIALRYLQHLAPRTATPMLIEALLTQLDRGHAKAARVLGRIGNPALQPVLEWYVRSPHPAVAELTKQALAKLGDQYYLAEILAELEVEDRHVRSEAFRKLAYVQDQVTVRQIAPFLRDPGPLPLADGHVRYTPYRFLAAWALGQIVDAPPVKKDLAGLYTEADVKTWQTWWESHQHTYP
jgi:HEAT repeat protein